mmetsp:Transcript_125582/g.217752  ORF Transcript_125582/g.217752 Transcript_125582/m.217752 type:complete len:251 (+) Transcript_125582:852-1604(+)
MGNACVALRAPCWSVAVPAMGLQPVLLEASVVVIFTAVIEVHAVGHVWAVIHGPQSQPNVNDPLCPIGPIDDWLVHEGRRHRLIHMEGGAAAGLHTLRFMPDEDYAWSGQRPVLHHRGGVGRPVDVVKEHLRFARVWHFKAFMKRDVDLRNANGSLGRKRERVGTKDTTRHLQLPVDGTGHSGPVDLEVHLMGHAVRDPLLYRRMGEVHKDVDCPRRTAAIGLRPSVLGLVEVVHVRAPIRPGRSWVPNQ